VTVADPVHLIWELGALGGDDRLEAAETWIAIASVSKCRSGPCTPAALG
jgi:hypothetical protein